MYPNPVSNQLTIEAEEEIQKITIYNLLGKEVLVKKQVNKTTTIQTNGLQKGVYIVKTTINGRESISKFIKK